MMTVELKAYGEKGKRVEVASVAMARAVHRLAIDAGPYGASAWQGGTIRVDGKVKGYLSYNGRLWTRGKNQTELNDDFTRKAPR